MESMASAAAVTLAATSLLLSARLLRLPVAKVSTPQTRKPNPKPRALQSRSPKHNTLRPNLQQPGKTQRKYAEVKEATLLTIEVGNYLTTCEFLAQRAPLRWFAANRRMAAGSMQQTAENVLCGDMEIFRHATLVPSRLLGQ